MTASVASSPSPSPSVTPVPVTAGLSGPTFFIVTDLHLYTVDSHLPLDRNYGRRQYRGMYCGRRV